MWERCVSFPSELDRRLFSRGGGLEAGSELSAWTETSQAVWLAGGEPGQSGSWWAAITSAIDSGLSFPVPPEPKAH